jgi:hypothetical protein
MVFIEGELFQDKRRNLIIYDGNNELYWQETMMTFIERELFRDKRRNLAFYEKSLGRFFLTET